MEPLEQQLEEFVGKMEGLILRLTDEISDGGESAETAEEMKALVNTLPTQKKIGEIWQY